MNTEYYNKLKERTTLSHESLNAISKCVRKEKFLKGDLILKHGDICKDIYYVNSGFIRIFYYKNGKEITEWFSNEKNFFFSIASYFNEEPSKLVIEAVEDCEIIYLSKKGLEKLRKTNLEIANLLIVFFSGSLLFSQIRMESIQFETASQRYESLLRNQPEILNKVSLQHIASYLGITQETLSRIRSKK